jgi:undecaprenyl pyrophosphate synthase
MPYTARDEISSSVQATIELHQNGDIPFECVLFFSIRSFYYDYPQYLCSTVFRRDMNENEIAVHLGTALSGSPRLDMMIRTSGVKRLSDFLLWQVRTRLFHISQNHTPHSLRFMLRPLIFQTCVDTQIYFTPTYWPDFGLWEFGKIILDYQRKVWSESRKPCAVTAGRC